MEFSRQEYWSGFLFPPSEDLPNSGIEAVSPALAGRFFTAESSGKLLVLVSSCQNWFIRGTQDLCISVFAHHVYFLKKDYSKV